MPLQLFSKLEHKDNQKLLKLEYSIDVMRRSACLVINPVTVYSVGVLLNCMTVGQA